MCRTPRLQESPGDDGPTPGGVSGDRCAMIRRTQPVDSWRSSLEWEVPLMEHTGGGADPRLVTEQPRADLRGRR